VQFYCYKFVRIVADKIFVAAGCAMSQATEELIHFIDIMPCDVCKTLTAFCFQSHAYRTLDLAVETLILAFIF
jgi:hypothetical protein